MSLEGKAAADSVLRGKINGLDVIYTDTYKIAVANGYEGTIEEWLASLKGEKGDKGEQGIQGIQGIQGEKGDKGDKGDTYIIPVDEELSTTSENPVQNKVVTAALNAVDKQIADKLCEEFTVSGDVVKCHPVESYPLTVEVVTAATESVTVWRVGKNLIPDSLTTTVNGITFTAEDDGTITISGTATAHASIKIPFQPHLPSGTYTLSLNNAKALGNNNVYIMLRDYAGSYGSALVYANTANASKTFTNPDVKVDTMLMVLNGTTLDGFTVKPQLEVGSVATAYEPYWGEAYTVETDNPATILALPGVNTLYADSGKVTVVGRENPAHAIEELRQAIISLGGNV